VVSQANEANHPTANRTTTQRILPMSLSLTARYAHIAAIYTYHAGIAARRVWDRHSMTARTMQTALTTANTVIHLCAFIWWLVNESDWSKDIKHIRSSPMQAIAAPDLTPTIEDIEEQLREAMPEPESERSPEPAPTPAAAPSMSWTKPDLVSACRCYGLSTKGSKAALLERLGQRLGMAAAA